MTFGLCLIKEYNFFYNNYSFATGITCIEIPRSTSSTKKKKPAISFQLALDYSPPSDDPVTPVRVANCVTPEGKFKWHSLVTFWPCLYPAVFLGLSYSDAYTKFASFKKIGTCNVIDVSHRCPQFGWKRSVSYALILPFLYCFDSCYTLSFRMESAKGKPDSDHYYRLIRALHDRIVGRNRSPLYICPFGCVNGAVSAWYVLLNLVTCLMIWLGLLLLL